MQHGVRIRWRDVPGELDTYWFESKEYAEKFGAEKDNEGYLAEYGLTRLVIDLP